MVEKSRAPRTETVASAEISTDVVDKLGEQLTERAERAAEEAKTEETAAEARHKAAELARSAEEEVTKTAETVKQSTAQPLTKQDVAERYQQTLRRVQSQLPAPSRAFSKVIHNPVVDKASDVIGNTVARPNLIIAGAIGAIASIIVYVIAQRYGYPLSGSEAMVLFVLGWLIGAIIEYARVGFANKRSSS